MSSELTVAFVCTGNRFRSPLAAAALGTAARGAPVAIASFGTLETAPLPPLAVAVEAAAEIGVDLSGHRSLSLVGADLRGTDVVIGFERMHLAAAVVDAGARREAAFTLPELVELLDEAAPPADADRVARARRALALAASQRPSEVAAWRPPELPDPITRPAAEQRELAARVHALCLRLAEQLFGLH